jgi:hypothetical protein
MMLERKCTMKKTRTLAQQLAPTLQHPAHTFMKTTEFVTNNNMVIVPHPPYLPHLAPCDFTLFPKLKMKLKGQRFETVSDIQKESKVVFDRIKENYFHSAFEAWKK